MGLGDGDGDVDVDVALGDGDVVALEEPLEVAGLLALRAAGFVPCVFLLTWVGDALAPVRAPVMSTALLGMVAQAGLGVGVGVGEGVGVAVGVVVGVVVVVPPAERMAASGPAFAGGAVVADDDAAGATLTSVARA